MEDCKSRVEEFVEKLARLARRDLALGKRLTLQRVLAVAEEEIARHGACSAPKPGVLRSQLNMLPRLAVDAAMEALSVHMEALDKEEYAALSTLLTAYAAHVARLALAALDIVEGLDDVGDIVLGRLEPMLFAAAARMLAVARMVRNMSTERLRILIPRLQVLIDTYIGEDNAAFTEVLEG